MRYKAYGTSTRSDGTHLLAEADRLDELDWLVDTMFYSWWNACMVDVVAVIDTGAGLVRTVTR